MANNLPSRMIKGDRKAIAEGLSSTSPYIKICALQWAAYYRVINPETISKIAKLKNDDSVDMGYQVSNFAVAALDVLGIEKYKGQNKEMLALIANFVFPKDKVDKMISNLRG